MVGAKILGIIEERTSKNGKPYTCIVFKLNDTYEKIVLINKLELEVLKTYISK